MERNATLVNIPARFSGLFQRYKRKEQDTERAQAVVRLIIIPFFVSYLVYVGLSQEFSSQFRAIYVSYWVYYVISSAVLFLCIVAWPGTYLLRRIFSMSHDYLAMTFAMSAGGETALPVYAILLWVTVGNGLRYGPGYLIAATAVALVALAATTYFNSFWRSEPYVVVTLVMTA
ncbi:hypothetical protein SAMN05443582_1161, partial [Phyllobacterium sp. OV277]